MWIEFKNYQEKAIVKLKQEVNDILDAEGNKICNIYVRENERDNNLSNIVARTKDEGRIIILIIDESHHTANSEKSKELIQDIGPKVTIEVSATQQISDANRIIDVDR